MASKEWHRVKDRHPSVGGDPSKKRLFLLDYKLHRGFTRVHLAPDESKPVQFELNVRDLSYVNAAGERLVGARRYRINVGGGQPTSAAPKIEGAVQIGGRQPIDP